jgi:hypothetical protein
VFFEVDVIGQASAEGVHQLKRRVMAQPAGIAADEHVVLEHAGHDGVGGVAVFGVAGSRISSSTRTCSAFPLIPTP